MRQRKKLLVHIRVTILDQYRHEGGKPLEEVRRELGVKRKTKKPSKKARR